MSDFFNRIDPKRTVAKGSNRLIATGGDRQIDPQLSFQVGYNSLQPLTCSEHPMLLDLVERLADHQQLDDIYVRHVIILRELSPSRITLLRGDEC